MDDGRHPIATRGEIGPSLLLTFVHGTWGRGFFPTRNGDIHSLRPARWYSPHSKFSRALLSCLQQHGIEGIITPLLWSGSNSVVARDEAAKALARHLNLQQQANPCAPKIIVAHSHGGNVAVRATKYIHFTANIHLITIATPFVQVNKGIVKPLSNLAYMCMLLVSAFIIFIYAMMLFVTVFPRFNKLGSPTPIFGYVVAIILFYLALLVANFTVVVAAEGIARLNLVELTSPSQKKHYARILVVRGARDEAALGLFIGELRKDVAASIVKIFSVTAAIILGIALSPRRLAGSETCSKVRWLYFSPSLDSFRSSTGWSFYLLRCVNQFSVGSLRSGSPSMKLLEVLFRLIKARLKF